MPSFFLAIRLLRGGVNENRVHFPVQTQTPRTQEQPLLARGEPVPDGDVTGAALSLQAQQKRERDAHVLAVGEEDVTILAPEEPEKCKRGITPGCTVHCFYQSAVSGFQSGIIEQHDIVLGLAYACSAKRVRQCIIIHPGVLVVLHGLRNIALQDTWNQNGHFHDFNALRSAAACATRCISAW
jgi:hypothetical protein